MKPNCHKLIDMIVDFLNNKYTFAIFEVLAEEPMVITMAEVDHIELMLGYGDDESNATNYELLENIIISVIDDIREAFDLDADYLIGTENIVEISLF